MKIRILNPVVTGYNVSAITGRKNFQTFLATKGVTEWNFDIGENIFYATVPDTFNLANIAQFGTVQKAVMQIVGWENA
jgi:hypothetical protein